jgi:hypothetical protein
MAVDTQNPEPSVASLVAGVVNDAQELIRQQFALLRSEVVAELRQARTAAISMSVGVGLAAVGALLLILMAIHALDAYTELPLWACFGIVGGALAAGGGALLYLGGREAADVHLMPPVQTAEAMKENMAWLKNKNSAPVG